MQHYACLITFPEILEARPPFFRFQGWKFSLTLAGVSPRSVAACLHGVLTWPQLLPPFFPNIPPSPLSSSDFPVSNYISSSRVYASYLFLFPSIGMEGKQVIFLSKKKSKFKSPPDISLTQPSLFHPFGELSCLFFIFQAFLSLPKIQHYS